MTAEITRTAPLVDTVVAALDDAAIRWVLLRGRAGLGLPDKDLDILVDRTDLARMEDSLFELGGVALPRSLHPWHRFYLVPDPATGESLELDVVSELVYSRRLRLRSRLEDGCLDRRVRTGGLTVLDPTDEFWTVLLHCVLDKQDVNERRRAELLDVVGRVERPSEGEAFFDSVCPPDWSADRALTAVRTGDWQVLARTGRAMVAHAGPTHTAGPSPVARVRGAARAAVRPLYPAVWRRAGLGVTPSVLDVVERATVPATVVDLRRHPGRCDVVLGVDDLDRARLVTAMRGHFVRIGRWWTRPTLTGLERVRLVSPSQDVAIRGVRSTALPMRGRIYCTRATTAAPPTVTHRGQVRVSFSGLDGAGKTRQIDALVGAYGTQHAVEVLWVPFKTWPEDLLNRLPAGFRSRLGPKRETALTAAAPSSTQPNRAGTVPGLRSLGWTAIATVAAVSAGLSLRRRSSSSEAEVLVLDRYRLDTVVKLQFWYPEVSGRWLAWVVESIAPAADVEFFLRVDPRVAYARKPEQWSVRQLTRQAQLYDRLIARSPEVVTLHAQGDLDDIWVQVAARVEAALDDR